MSEEKNNESLDDLLNELKQAEIYAVKVKKKEMLEHAVIAIHYNDRKEQYLREDKVASLLKIQQQLVKEAVGQVKLVNEALEQVKHKQEALEMEKKQWTNTYEKQTEELEKIKQAYEKLKRESAENYEVLAKTIFEGINNLDQMIAAFSQSNELVANQLASVANIIIQQLANVGIVEIPTYGKEIDGDYMESMGVVSIDEVEDKELKAHEVAKVIRRAFKNEKTNEILQFALVETIEGDE